jgi:hypothetical protein
MQFCIILSPEQFQEKCERLSSAVFAVTFRQELRQNRMIGRFAVSVKREPFQQATS